MSEYFLDGLPNDFVSIRLEELGPEEWSCVINVMSLGLGLLISKLSRSEWPVDLLTLSFNSSTLILIFSGWSS